MLILFWPHKSAKSLSLFYFIMFDTPPLPKILCLCIILCFYLWFFLVCVQKFLKILTDVLEYINYYFYWNCIEFGQNFLFIILNLLKKILNLLIHEPGTSLLFKAYVFSYSISLLKL